jgi:hypothetical protein
MVGDNQTFDVTGKAIKVLQGGVSGFVWWRVEKERKEALKMSSGRVQGVVRDMKEDGVFHITCSIFNSRALKPFGDTTVGLVE